MTETLWEDGRDPMGVDALQWAIDEGRKEIAKQSGGLAGAIMKGYKSWERKPHDLYPTPFDATESIMPVVKTMLPNGGKVWECACGDLDITRVLEFHGFEVTSTDIRENAQGIGGFDFLCDDPVEKWGWFPDPDLILTNPPFALAEAFVRKALSYTPNVILLLKMDYWSAATRLKLFTELRPKLFLPLTFRPAFLRAERGNSPLMNVAWCVWTDSDENYCTFEPIPKLIYPGYQGNGVATSMSKLGQAIDDLLAAL